MWNYDRKLQYPVNIKNPDAKAAKIIISQYGGLNLNKILYKNNLMILVIKFAK